MVNEEKRGDDASRLPSVMFYDIGGSVHGRAERGDSGMQGELGLRARRAGGAGAWSWEG